MRNRLTVLGILSLLLAGVWLLADQSRPARAAHDLQADIDAASPGDFAKFSAIGITG